jgi:hypothetical protein
VKVDGQNLSGDIQIVQQNVSITPALSGQLATLPIGDALTDTLGRMNSTATHITLGGTLEEPTCTVWSNIGPAMAEAFQRAVDRVSSQHTRRMLVDAGKQVDERLANVDRQLAEQQNRLNATLTDINKQLQGFAAGDSPRNRISVERVGRRLPSGALFR